MLVRFAKLARVTRYRAQRSLALAAASHGLRTPIMPYSQCAAPRYADFWRLAHMKTVQIPGLREDQPYLEQIRRVRAQFWACVCSKEDELIGAFVI
jgi:hypothetical protein